MIYVASPYTNTDTKKQRQNLWLTEELMGRLYKKYQLFIVSPIIHWAAAADACDLPHRYEFWKPWDEACLRDSEAVWILMLRGWETSEGVLHEIKLAEKLNKPIFLVDTNFLTLQEFTHDKIKLPHLG